MTKTEKICADCKLEKPVTDFGFVNGKPNCYCRKCKSRRDGEYRKKHSEKIKEKKRVEYQESSEKVRQRSRDWYRANKEHACIVARKNVLRKRDYVLARQKEWYLRNKERILAKASEYRKINSFYISQWHAKWRSSNKAKIASLNRRYYIANKDKCYRHSAIRRARKQNAEGGHTKADILRILAAQKCKCIVCRTNIEKCYTVDHIVPLSRGGSDNPENLQMVCKSCNSKKGAKDPIEFMQASGFLL